MCLKINIFHFSSEVKRVALDFWGTMAVVSSLDNLDNLDEEAVGGVERLRDIRLGGDCSAMGLPLVKAWGHPIRDWEESQGGGVSRFEAMNQNLHDGREQPLQDLCCRAEHWDWAIGALVASLLSGWGQWRSFSKLQGCQLRQLKVEELCLEFNAVQPRWWPWSMVTQSGPHWT